jgi:hypothetical protein
MRAPFLELERRRPMWVALSELFPDTELGPEDYQRIAQVLSVSGYSETELEQILCRELGPVLFFNLLIVAEEWAGFDSDRLEKGILRRERHSWLRWVPGFATLRMVGRDWACIRALLTPKESA